MIARMTGALLHLCESMLAFAVEEDAGDGVKALYAALEAREVCSGDDFVSGSALVARVESRSES